MKYAKVLHNPGAGEGETSKRELISQLEAAGFKCSYSSTKHFRWENIGTQDKLDFLVLAGGDGTVRKVADGLLSRKMTEKKYPLALLPFGTANNIALTLGLSDSVERNVRGWRKGALKKFDVGVIDGLDQPAFFLEGFGYGLFPKLMHAMERKKHNDIPDPKEKLQTALELLHEMVLTAPVKKCQLQIDEIDYSGEFLLIEVMNIRSIGPNLTLAPEADPGDGEFEVVLVTEKQRDHLAEYVKQKIAGEEVPFDFPLLKAKRLKISWDGKHVHVDDEYHKLEKPIDIRIEMREGLLEFLLPEVNGV
jgi:diacylglycerol kinase family enzyme